MPTSLSIDKNKQLTLRYKKHEFNLPLAEVAIGFQEGSLFNALYIYKIITNTRGHQILKEVNSIVGTSYKIGYKKSQISEIYQALEMAGALQKKAQEKKTLLRLLSE